MSTKTIVVAACLFVAALIFFAFGLDIVSTTKYDMGLVGLGFFDLGMLVWIIWAPGP